MNDLQCSLCPRGCFISDGESGNCRIRINLNGKLHAVTYAHPCSLHVDPIEKKPLFHFHPASKAFSVATVGCTMHCKNCQNWEISQQFPDRVPAYKISPAELANLAEKNDCKSIAYTYTDPCAFYEYALDCSIKAKEKGIKNILVTAAYINSAPFKELLKYTDAANIDMKAFSDKFYNDVCGSTLKPVLDNLVLAKESGIVFEVTNLLIPGLNDSDKMIKDLCSWHAKNLGTDVPIHFSRFTPRYKMKNLPSTPLSTLDKAEKIAKDNGIEYIYIGNIISDKSSNTYCPKCGKELIKRRIYKIR